jgi:cytochrome c-type biogenesis protein CcmH
MTRLARWSRAFVLFLAVLIAAPAAAVQPDEILADPALEQRARKLSTELRCLVCQNQSIDDSDAPLARDLRLIVRERLKAGDSDSAVMSFVVARYGEFVLLRPRLTAQTVLLWGLPFAAFGLAALLIMLKARRSAATIATVPTLSAEEERRLKDRLGQSG